MEVSIRTLVIDLNNGENIEHRSWALMLAMSPPLGRCLYFLRELPCGKESPEVELFCRNFAWLARSDTWDCESSNGTAKSCSTILTRNLVNTNSGSSSAVSFLEGPGLEPLNSSLLELEAPDELQNVKLFIPSTRKSNRQYNCSSVRPV